MTAPATKENAIPIWLLVTVLVIIGGISALALAYRAQARATGIELANVVAQTDSLHTWVLREEQVHALMAAQNTIQADSIDVLVKRAPVVKTVVQVRIDTFRINVPVITSADAGDSVRSTDFTKDSTPFHVTGHVTLPRAPGVGSIALQMVLDTIPLDTRVGCASAAGGVRSAAVYVTGPAWAHIGLRSPQVDPDVCNATVLPGFAVSLHLPWWVSLITFIGGFFSGDFLH